MHNIGSVMKAVAEGTQRIEQEKRQLLMRSQNANIDSAAMLERLHEQGEKQIELLTSIKGLLERVAPPAAPDKPIEQPSLRASLAFVDDK